MASKRIDINVNGKDNTSGAFNSAAKNISKLGQQAGKTGTTIGSALSKGASTGTAALGKVSSVGSAAFGKLATIASQTASSIGKSFSNLGSNISSALSGIDSMGGALAGLTGGYGLLEMATDAWNGAVQRQGNQAYLQLNLGAEAAKSMTSAIQGIVAAVPGDDTMMNNLLSTAAARGAAISDLKTLGGVAADYYAAATKTGMSLIEANQDLTSYITTGTTGELQRSRILVGQVESLEGQATVAERIVALNKALVANGYAGLSTMDTAALKLEILKGKFQLALTNVGSAILVLITPVIDFFTKLDEVTGGMSTTFIAVAAACTFLTIAIAGLVVGIQAMGITMGMFLAIAGPVGAIILGIGLAVAAGIYIWQTWGDKIQETIGFLQAGNWGGVAANIGSAFNFVKDSVVNAITGIPAAIGNLAGSMVSIGSQIVQWLVSGLTNLSGWLDQQLSAQMTSAGGNGGQGLITGFTNWINANGPTIVNTIIMVITRLIPLLLQVGVKASMLLMQGIGRGLAGLGGYLMGWIVAPFAAAGNAVVGVYNWVKSIVTRALSSVTGFTSWGSNAVSSAYNWLKSVVSNTISSATQFWSWGADSVMSTYNWLKNTVGNGIQSVVSFVTGGGGPAGPAFARGPGSPFDDLSLHYEGYQGHQKNAWTGNGSMSGNCVDMSLGLIQAAGGGQLISGTWGGSPHVWARIGGKDYDPAMKALHNTWTPPARGPATTGPMIVFEGPVYGMDDFDKKVEQASSRLYRGAI